MCAKVFVLLLEDDDKSWAGKERFKENETTTDRTSCSRRITAAFARAE